MVFDFLLPDACLGWDMQGNVQALDPSNLHDDPRGLSGTEVNALGLAYTLGRLRHRVRIVTQATSAHDCDGVTFLPKTRAFVPGEVAVAFHDASMLQHWPSPVKVAWHQTLLPPDWEYMGRQDVDLYLSATRHNARHLSQYTGDKTWSVVPNGWDFDDRFQVTGDRLQGEDKAQPSEPLTPYPYNLSPSPVPGRLFFHTSPERGLHVLLQALPLIRQRVPYAHLHAWCRGLKRVERFYPALWAPIRDGLVRCAAWLTLYPEGGSRRQVLADLASAQVLAYPSEPPAPCEVMPVSVMEACALGVPVVTAPSDGFEKAFGQALTLCPGPPSQHLEAFAERVCAVLQTPKLHSLLQGRGRRFAARHTFAQTAQRFLAVVREAQRRKQEVVHA